jgi:hypothetical protein
VNAEQYEKDMAELEHYRRQQRKTKDSSFSGLIKIVGDLEGCPQRLTEEYQPRLPERRYSAKCHGLIKGQ